MPITSKAILYADNIGALLHIDSWTPISCIRFKKLKTAFTFHLLRPEQKDLEFFRR
jgi:hypothetical protein